MCVCFVRWACAWVRVCVRVQVFLPLFIAVGSVLVAQFMAFCVQCAVWNHPSRQSTVNMVASYSVEGYVPMMLLRNVRRRTMHVGGGCVVSSTTNYVSIVLPTLLTFRRRTAKQAPIQSTPVLSLTLQQFSSS